MLNNFREIGGYLELERNRLPLLHESALALNCGRNALRYLLEQRKIRCGQDAALGLLLD